MDGKPAFINAQDSRSTAVLPTRIKSNDQFVSLIRQLLYNIVEDDVSLEKLD